MGADLTGRPHLRRNARITATVALSASMLALVHDLGRPTKFYNMLRVFKPTSPMSVGTWVLTAYAPGNVVAGAAEVARLLDVERFLPPAQVPEPACSTGPRGPAASRRRCSPRPSPRTPPCC